MATLNQLEGAVATIRAYIEGKRVEETPPEAPIVENTTTTTNITLRMKLSAREMEILVLAANGASNKETARKLDLADATVKVHRKTLMRKMGVNSITHAVAFALRSGLIK